MSYFIVIDCGNDRVKNKENSIRCIKVNRTDDLAPLMNLESESLVFVLSGNGKVSKEEYLRRFLKRMKGDLGAEMFSRAMNTISKLDLKGKIKVTGKILPICCMCKNIRDDERAKKGEGSWMTVEEYLYEKADIHATSTYCPECAKKVMKQE